MSDRERERKRERERQIRKGMRIDILGKKL